MRKIKYHYEVNEHISRHEIESYECVDEFDFEQLAAACADDYHSNHDGWESSWPVEMVVYEYADSEDGKELWRGEVDREAVPHFRAYTERLSVVEHSDKEQP